MRTFGRWSVSMSSVWRSGYPITVPVAQYAVSDPLGDAPEYFLHRPFVNNGRLPVYFRLGVQAGYWFTLEDATVSLRVQAYNATGRRNVVDRVYGPTSGGPVAIEDRVGVPLIPLFELKVTY